MEKKLPEQNFEWDDVEKFAKFACEDLVQKVENVLPSLPDCKMTTPQESSKSETRKEDASVRQEHSDSNSSLHPEEGLNNIEKKTGETTEIAEISHNVNPLKRKQGGTKKCQELSPKKKSRISDINDVEKFKEPFKYGFKRELVHRATVQIGRKSSDVYYTSPEGVRMRSIPNVEDFLKKTPNKYPLTAENFTYASILVYKGPLETVRLAKPITNRNSSPKKQPSPKVKAQKQIKKKKSLPKDKVSEEPVYKCAAVRETKASSLETQPIKIKFIKQVLSEKLNVSEPEQQSNVSPGQKRLEQPKKTSGPKIKYVPTMAERKKMLLQGKMVSQKVTPVYSSKPSHEMSYSKVLSQSGNSKAAVASSKPTSQTLKQLSKLSGQIRGLPSIEPISTPHLTPGIKTYQIKKEEDPEVMVTAPHLTPGIKTYQIKEKEEPEVMVTAEVTKSCSISCPGQRGRIPTLLCNKCDVFFHPACVNYGGKAVDSLNYTCPSCSKEKKLESNLQEVQPCSLNCPGVVGMMPTLQCKTCCCMFHPFCVAFPAHKNPKTFTCKPCQQKKLDRRNFDIPEAEDALLIPSAFLNLDIMHEGKNEDKKPKNKKNQASIGAPSVPKFLKPKTTISALALVDKWKTTNASILQQTLVGPKAQATGSGNVNPLPNNSAANVTCTNVQLPSTQVLSVGSTLSTNTASFSKPPFTTILLPPGARADEKTIPALLNLVFPSVQCTTPLTTLTLPPNSSFGIQNNNPVVFSCGGVVSGSSFNKPLQSLPTDILLSGGHQIRLLAPASNTSSVTSPVAVGKSLGASLNAKPEISSNPPMPVIVESHSLNPGVTSGPLSTNTVVSSAVLPSSQSRLIAPRKITPKTVSQLIKPSSVKPLDRPAFLLNNIALPQTSVLQSVSTIRFPSVINKAPISTPQPVALYKVLSNTSTEPITIID